VVELVGRNFADVMRVEMDPDTPIDSGVEVSVASPSEMRPPTNVFGFRQPPFLRQPNESPFVQHEKPGVELLQMWTCRLIEQPALDRSRVHRSADFRLHHPD